MNPIQISKERYQAALRICLVAAMSLPDGGSLEPLIYEQCGDDHGLYAICVYIMAETIRDVRREGLE